MKRKQLKELPLPQKLKSTKHVGGKKFNRWGACALYSSNIDESTGEEILIIDLFNHQSGEFGRRFFFSADNWFSINKEKESSSAQIMGELYYGYDFKPITKADSLTIKEFFSENKHIEESKWKLYNPSGIDLAQCFCEVISEERRERGRCNTKSRTERELAELKNRLKDFFLGLIKPQQRSGSAYLPSLRQARTQRRRKAIAPVAVKRLRLNALSLERRCAAQIAEPCATLTPRQRT